MPTFKYEIDGHGFEADHPLTPEEASAIKQKLAPPLSKLPMLAAEQEERQPESFGPKKIATSPELNVTPSMVRVGLPLGAVALGGPMGLGVAATAALGAGGAAAGTLIGNRMEGKETTPLELTAETALGAFAPGPGRTVLKGAGKAALYGLTSTSISSYTRGEGLPGIGKGALDTIVAGLFGAGITKLHLRSSLKEIFPEDVADGVHSIMVGDKAVPWESVAKGPGFKTEPISSTLKSELKEIKDVTKQLSLPLKKGPVPDVDISGVSTVRPPPYVPTRTMRGQYTRPGAFEQTEFPGMSRVKRLNVRVGTREPFDAPELEKVRTGRAGPAVGDIEPLPTPEVRPTTALLRRWAPPIWLYTRLQRQTGIPVYDDVYRPVIQAMGSEDELNKVISNVRAKYNLKDESIPGTVRRAIDHTLKIAKSTQDGSMRDLTEAIQGFGKKLPFFRREISGDTAKRLAAHLVTLQYSGTLPGRVGPAVRQFAQNFQTGYMYLGERWYVRGLRKALTPPWRAYREAKLEGALGSEELVEELSEIGEDAFSRIMRYGFMPYRAGEHFNRTVIYIGQRDRTMWAAKQAKGNVERFVDLANLDTAIPRPEAIRIAKLYAEGRWAEASREAGKIRVTTTQFGYASPERPEIATKTGGRLLFGFYNWSAWYGNLLKETFISRETPLKKKMLMGARFLVANAVLYDVSKRIWTRAYDDPEKGRERARDFTGLGPVLYGGAPAVTLLSEGGRGARDILGGEYKRGGKRLLRATKPFIPGAGAAEDIYDLFKEE